ncbi:hypothetical protein K439DRAFT_1626681 [Ramaria rubella]|nr:hypothetical protein K439DRAFT_1626681 [Ramaria rubella]
MANPRTRWNTVDPEEQATLKPRTICSLQSRTLLINEPFSDLGTSPLIPSPIPEFPQLVFHFPGVLESLSGMPTVDEYAAIQERFLSGLPADERSTVLIDSRIYVHVLDILTGRAVKDIRPAQFHSWALKTFQLQRCTYTLNHPEVVHESWDVFHEGKKIALVEELYTILCRAHCECGHGGAEETIDEVRREWRFVPKDLIARFVEACPTCMEKYAPEKQVTSFKTATRTNKEGQYVDVAHIARTQPPTQGILTILDYPHLAALQLHL